MIDKWLEEIRKKISCPQLGDDHYGEWGILTKYQRFTIKRMLDFIEGQEAYIKRLRAENERLREKLNIELENFATEYDNKIKAEAYKEFAKLLRQQAFDRLYVSIDELDNLLKELVGEDNG